MTIERVSSRRIGLQAYLGGLNSTLSLLRKHSSTVIIPPALVSSRNSILVSLRLDDRDAKDPGRGNDGEEQHRPHCSFDSPLLAFPFLTLPSVNKSVDSRRISTQAAGASSSEPLVLEASGLLPLADIRTDDLPTIEELVAGEQRSGI